jgi:hypothetical protein
MMLTNEIAPNVSNEKNEKFLDGIISKSPQDSTTKINKVPTIKKAKLVSKIRDASKLIKIVILNVKVILLLP